MVGEPNTRTKTPEDLRVIVHRWEVRGELPESVVDEMFLAHRLRNDLVATELAYRDAVQRIWSQYPTLAAAENAVERAATEVADARNRVSAYKSHQSLSTGRSVRTASPELRQALKDAQTALKEARAERSKQKERYYNRAKAQFAAARQSQRDEVKRLRQHYCSNRTSALGDRERRDRSVPHVAQGDRPQEQEPSSW